jgi:hypothetical protein
MENQSKNPVENSEELDNDSAHEAESKVSDKGEFKITVRKLEMPVRPRGVLAE